MIQFIALLLILLSGVLFFYNWKGQRNAIYLSLSLAITGLMFLSEAMLVYGESAFWLAVLFIHFVPLYYLLGPLLYFYIRGTLSDRPRIRARDAWHFIPFIVSLISILPYLFKPWSDKLFIANELVSDLHNLVRFSDLTLYPSGVNRILRPLLWLGYISYCLMLLFRFYRSYPRQTRIPLTDALPVFRFLLFFLLVSLFTCASYLAISLLIASDASISRIRYLSSPLMSLVLAGLFGLIMILLINPAVLYGIPRLRREGQIRQRIASMEDSALVFDVEEPEVEQIKQEPLREAGERFSELAASIPRVIAEKKLYLNPDFNLDDLAKALDVPKHHLYYCFNSLLHTRFTRMRTEFRVRHVQQLIREGASKQKTLDAIGLESGFSSSATFRAAFRDVTGMSPSEFQASLASP